MNAEMAVVRESFEKSMSSLLEAFDAHMNRSGTWCFWGGGMRSVCARGWRVTTHNTTHHSPTTAPSMAALPVQVVVVLEASKTQVEGIVIQPNGTT